MRMLRKWLKRRFELSAIQSGREGLEQFVSTLGGQSESEIATLVAVATIIRIRLRDAGHLPDDVLRVTSTDEYEQAMVQQRIARLVRQSQSRNEYIDAAGAMVWLHTLRSLRSPELRVLGRRMWQQLERGFQHAPEAVARIEALTHEAPPAGTLSACVFLPEDLDPAALP
ncbi:MAG: hypothetical protein ACREVV_01045 [Steroidobacteraceae bacterium]